METFLIVQRGEDIGRRYDLDATQLTIGRGADNDLVLNDPMVSRYHAVVKRQGDRYTIIDLGSANPVVINDRVLDAGLPQHLQHRDVVFIGKTVFSFQSRAVAGRAASPASEQPRARERPAPPHTPTLETPPLAPVMGTEVGAAGDAGETMLFPPPDPTPGSPAGRDDADDRTMVGGFRLDEPGDQPPPLPTPPNFEARDDEPPTYPGLRQPAAAAPPLPPFDPPPGREGPRQEEGDYPIGTPPDDDSGDSPTVFIPRERR